MNNQKIINEIKELLSKLEQELKNIKIDDDMEKFKVFKPKENENYFFINVDGDVLGNTNLSGNDFNNSVLKRNRVFKTKEHAEEYRNFMDMLKEKSKPFKTDEHNYGLYYDSTLKKIRTTWTEFALEKILYFDERVAKYLVEKYPSEIKYWYLEMPYED